jgi:diguanylate cyclase (GGDEF)-like protein
MSFASLGRNWRWLFAIFIGAALASKSVHSLQNDADQARPVALTQEEKAWILDHPEIKVAMQHGWAPIEYLSESNEFRGLSVDYLNRLEKILGLNFKKTGMPETASTEVADMLSAVPSAKALDDTSYIALDEPYLTMPIAIFTHKNNRSIHSLDDLAGKKVAVFKTGIMTQLIPEQYPEIQLYKVDIAEEALGALISGQVDAYVGNKLIISYIGHTQGLRSIKISGITPYTASTTIAVRADWPILKSILQKGLNTLNAEERQAILDNWSESHGPAIDYKLLFLAGALLAIIIAVLGHKSWQLNKEIKKRRKMSRDMIWRQANFDFLTHLPNRYMFHNRLEEEMKKADRMGLPLALLFLDLDHFKELNDSLGHGLGDMLLVAAAKRLRSCVRSVDTVARLGGDEFIVILSTLHDSTSVEKITQEILNRMAEPFELQNEVVYISASIGITMYPEDATGIEALLKNVDQAMYAAKSLGRNCFHYFTYSMQEAASNRMRIAKDLRTALSTNQFHLQYQPIVELASGSIHKAEALIRWQHPEQGLINPAQFISIAEDTGMIIPIGSWVFHEAAAQVAQWRGSLHPEFQVSINISPVQFKNDSNLQSWIVYLREQEMDGESIAIEITEGLLLEPKSTVKYQLFEFRNAGMKIAIDDFGTGYSALAYLRKFDVDYVKIDRSFVHNLTPDSDNMALCEAIILMAHKLGLKVIAEGIETLEQKSLLQNAGCDYGQGYFFTRPVPPTELEAYTRRSSPEVWFTGGAS